MFGHDNDLLDLRAQVLTYCGFQVATLCKTFGTELASHGVCFDLIVMCHTLARSEREKAFKMIRISWPRARIIVLTSAVNAAGNTMPGIEAVDGADFELLIAACCGPSIGFSSYKSQAGIVSDSAR
jgi:hypothetical protein